LKDLESRELKIREGESEEFNVLSNSLLILNIDGEVTEVGEFTKASINVAKQVILLPVNLINSE
jgi:hypothetical protein